MGTDMKIVVGVTGSFGTGKTFAASVFKSLGAEIIDADKIARRVLGKKREKAARAFGCVNRKALARLVFGSKKKLAKLNRMIHPDVIKIIKERIRGCGRGVVVIDAPLLVEANLTGMVNYIVIVRASRSNQIKRCVKKFGMTRSDVQVRISCQVPLKKKVGIADFVVDNDGARSATRKQVKEIWERISHK